MHNPAYRKKYELNLKREFPRLPFYKDFYKWVNWGKELMDLHINYETVEPYEIEIREEEKQKANPKAKLKHDKETVIDLIKRVTTVSVRTMEIVNQMEAEESHL